MSMIVPVDVPAENSGVLKWNVLLTAPVFYGIKEPVPVG
jgi:hypothetical protein